MDKSLSARLLVFGLMVSCIALARDASAASLPSSTSEILQKLKLDPSVLTNIDKELQVPKEWIDKAKQEGKVKILSTSSTVNPTELKKFYGSFKERYPFIQIDQSGASVQVRAIKTLLSYKNGRVITDIVTNLEHTFHDFKEAGALDDLRNIPDWNVIPDGSKGSDGSWVSPGVRHYCLAYNTNLVAPKDLPKKWEDLLKNPAWGNGNLGLVNRPQNWVLGLWRAKGTNWSKEYLTALFRDQKPQLRKEGMNAMLELAAAGEFHGAVPAQSNLVSQMLERGAPLSFSCPEPIPVTRSEFVLLKGAENPYAARIFINWLLSAEGQISQFYARSVPPAHKGLNLKELVPFGEQIIGKELSNDDPVFEREEGPEIFAFWNNLWMHKGKPQ